MAVFNDTDSFLSDVVVMRVVIQRVTQASVTVENNVVGKIGRGLVLLVGIKETDTM